MPDTRRPSPATLDDADLLDALDDAVWDDEPEYRDALRREVDSRPSLEVYHTPASEDDVGEPWSAPAKPE